MSGGALFVAVFLACAVEAVEATTIVLAAGTARDWRSALTGMAAGAGRAGGRSSPCSARPSPRCRCDALRLVVGALLLIFGLQWLRKAILRASGHKALHDEDADLPPSSWPPPRARRRRRPGSVPDWYAFTLSFKGVVLEGLEVVFIALTFGSQRSTTSRWRRSPRLRGGAGRRPVGFAVRAPLARVPENTLKFVVGIMLTAFGTFWGAEGAGADWPGSTRRCWCSSRPSRCFAIGAGRRCSRRRSARRPAPAGASRGEGTRVITRLRAFGAFWYDFVIGDDWRVAVGRGGRAGRAPACCSRTGAPAWWLVPLAVVLILPLSIWHLVRRNR